MAAKLRFLFAVFLTLATGGRAVLSGTALFGDREPLNERITEPRSSVPHSALFREVSGRGLLIRTWINSQGPFTFAIDTGAGATLLSQRVAQEAGVNTSSGRAISVAGLSGASSRALQVSIESLAIGDRENHLPGKGEVMVTSGLPPDLDGVLDPTEAFFPLGYAIDIPRHELSAFDPQATPVRMNSQPEEGTVVPWLRERHGRRPFVQLDNGDRALLDTGSGLGLAIRESSQPDREITASVRDIGGGSISARRVAARTISIGSLTLRRIPTDVVSGSEADAPVLLGLSALRPFRLRLDPVHRLIEIAPSESNRSLQSRER